MISDGNAAPLFWLPLLNPLDIAQCLVFIAFAVWLRRLKTLGIAWHPRVVDYVAIATVFLWFNALMLRTLHQRFHLATASTPCCRRSASSRCSWSAGACSRSPECG